MPHAHWEVLTLSNAPDVNATERSFMWIDDLANRAYLLITESAAYNAPNKPWDDDPLQDEPCNFTSWWPSPSTLMYIDLQELADAPSDTWYGSGTQSASAGAEGTSTTASPGGAPARWRLLDTPMMRTPAEGLWPAQTVYLPDRRQVFSFSGEVIVDGTGLQCPNYFASSRWCANATLRTHIQDVASMTWTSLTPHDTGPDMPSNDFGMRYAAVRGLHVIADPEFRDRVFAVGGFLDPSQPLQTVRAYSFSMTSMRWQRLMCVGDVPNNIIASSIARGASFFHSAMRRIIFFGGVSWSKVFSAGSCYIYYVDTGLWQSMDGCSWAGGPFIRSHAAAVLLPPAPGLTAAQATQGIMLGGHYVDFTVPGDLRALFQADAWLLDLNLQTWDGSIVTEYGPVPPLTNARIVTYWDPAWTAGPTVLLWGGVRSNSVSNVMQYWSAFCGAVVDSFHSYPHIVVVNASQLFRLRMTSSTQPSNPFTMSGAVQAVVMFLAWLALGVLLVIAGLEIALLTAAGKRFVCVVAPFLSFDARGDVSLDAGHAYALTPAASQSGAEAYDAHTHRSSRTVPIGINSSHHAASYSIATESRQRTLTAGSAVPLQTQRGRPIGHGELMPAVAFAEPLTMPGSVASSTGGDECHAAPRLVSRDMRRAAIDDPFARHPGVHLRAESDSLEHGNEERITKIDGVNLTVKSDEFATTRGAAYSPPLDDVVAQDVVIDQGVFAGTPIPFRVDAPVASKGIARLLTVDMSPDRLLRRQWLAGLEVACVLVVLGLEVSVCHFRFRDDVSFSIGVAIMPVLCLLRVATASAWASTTLLVSRARQLLTPLELDSYGLLLTHSRAALRFSLAAGFCVEATRWPLFSSYQAKARDDAPSAHYASSPTGGASSRAADGATSPAPDAHGGDRLRRYSFTNARGVQQVRRSDQLDRARLRHALRALAWNTLVIRFVAAWMLCATLLAPAFMVLLGLPPFVPAAGSSPVLSLPATAVPIRFCICCCILGCIYALVSFVDFARKSATLRHATLLYRARKRWAAVADSSIMASRATPLIHRPTPSPFST